MKKKILFIIWSFTYGGGAEKILANIVNNLDPNKYEIDIIEYWHTNIKTEIVNDNVNILPPIIDADNDSKIKKGLYKLLLEIFPRFLRMKYIKKKYDVEISFNYLIPTFLLNKKCKSIAWIHGDIYDLKENKKNYFLQKRSFKYVDKIVAISDNTYNSIKKVYSCFADKVILLNNGYDIKEMISKSKSLEITEKEKNSLLFINRFDANKNPLFALNVVKELDNRGIDFKLYYIGKGELEQEIIDNIKELKLENKVKILGYKNNPYPYIKNCDIVLGCSKTEGFPTIFIEAIALGKPFVTTAVGGSIEISDNQKCGLIADSFEDYVNDVELLINDKKMYMQFSKHGINHVKKFSLKSQIDKIEKLIEEISGDDR